MNKIEESIENITVWDDPESTVETVNGKFTYREWLEMERKRFLNKGKQTYIHTCVDNGRPKICLGRNPQTSTTNN